MREPVSDIDSLKALDPDPPIREADIHCGCRNVRFGQTLELFTHNKSAREAVDHARKIKILTALGSSAAQSTV
jgi:hypothetical protein